jgi:hypothetical protein
VLRGCRLYLTYRSEYLVLSDLCVGVRDRRSGAWQPLHAAACAHLLGPVPSHGKAKGDSSPLIQSSVRVGEQLCFLPSVRRVVTGPVVAIEEPSPALLREAEERWQELFAPTDPRDSVLLLGDKVR